MGNFTVDELSPVTLLFSVVWCGVGVGLLLLSSKQKGEWVKASLAGFGLSILGWHLLAIVPSWWLYYADGRLKWGGQGCVAIDGSCIKQSIKDTVVVIENAVILGAFIVAFIIWQKKFPKQLAPGESKPEATGGYK